MLEQAIVALTAQVAELNRLLAQLVADTTDAVELKKARKPRQSVNGPAPEDPAPAASSAAPAVETPSAAPEAAASPAPPSEAAAAASAPDYASLRASVRGAAMRLAARIGRDPAIARISEHLKGLGLDARNIGAVPDEHLQRVLVWLEAEVARVLQEAA